MIRQKGAQVGNGGRKPWSPFLISAFAMEKGPSLSSIIPVVHPLKSRRQGSEGESK
jgi:hypothetical protein